eukprot:TRINITY_DN191_c0_g1_i4.p1 TRINITY_DN191_c0_g1~~TRINITY_DN191_c0_g1_i4.p1  ORF type:complete len:307 (+),score=64.24 TRINITY_DN191_c0_g1_i4:68-988(+)
MCALLFTFVIFFFFFFFFFNDTATTEIYTLHIVGSVRCVQETAVQQQNHFIYGYYMIPHPEKIAKGGEDALYANNFILSVADGVGGWAAHGVDPAQYSRGLCRSIEQLWKQSKQSLYRRNPKLLLMDAQQQVTCLGSSTLVICTIDKERAILHATYMGDSGYLILRNDNGSLRIVHQYKEQQKSFNYPYQLGYKEHGDSPYLAIENDHQIQQNDVLILGTDGLFDNLHNHQIQDIIQNYKKQNATDNLTREQLCTIAKQIASEAYKYSSNELWSSPFSQRALQAGKYFQGGKPDDITVLIAQIKLS